MSGDTRTARSCHATVNITHLLIALTLQPYHRRCHTQALLWLFLRENVINIMDGTKRQCQRCYKWMDLDEKNFKKMRDDFSKTCIPCSQTRAEKRAKNKEEDSNKENPPAQDNEDQEDEQLRKELGNISLEEFVNSLSSTEDIYSLAAFVEISGLEGKNMRERVDKLAKIIWEQLKYRFV